MTTTKTNKLKRQRRTKFPGGAKDINSTLPVALHDWVSAQAIMRHCKRADILREALTLYMNQYEGQRTAAPVESCDTVSDEPEHLEPAEPAETSTRKIRKF